MILSDLGELNAARPLAERALAIDEAVYGPDHPDVATALNNLAMILSDLGELDAARPLAERAWPSTRLSTDPTTPTSPST